MLRWFRDLPPLHFEGEPDRIARMRALFAPESRLHVKYAEPNRAKFRHSRLRAVAERLVGRLKVRAA